MTLKNILSKRAYLLLFFIWLFCFLIMFFPVRTGYHYWDETIYLQHADIILGGYDNYNEFDFRPPLFPIMLAIGNLFFNSLITSHLIVAFIASLGVLGVFLLGKDLFNEKVGLISAIFYVFLPLNLILAHDLLVDTMLPVFLLFTTLFFIRAFKTEKTKYYIFGGILFALSLLLKFTSLSYGLVFLLIYLIINGKNSLRSIKRDYSKIILSIVTFLIVLLPYFIYSQIKYGSFLSTFIKGATIISWDVYVPMLYILKEFPKMISWHIIGLTFLGLAILVIRLKVSKESLILLICFIVPFALNFLVSHKEIRYFLPLAPFMVIFSSKVFYSMFHIKNKLLKILIIIVLLALLTFSLKDVIHRDYKLEAIKNFNFVIYEDDYAMMQAGLWLKNNTSNDMLIYVNNNWPVIAYYSKRDIGLLPLFRDFYSDIDEVMNESGYYILTESSKDRIPSLNFVLNDSRFQSIRDFGSGIDKVYLFSYNASSQSI